MGKVTVDKFYGEVFLRTDFEIWAGFGSAGQIIVHELLAILSRILFRLIESIYNY